MTFLDVLVRISPTKSTFSLGKMLVALDTYATKMNSPSIVLGGGGGGVHGKAACWLIAYKTIMQKLYTVIIYITQYSFTIYNI